MSSFRGSEVRRRSLDRLERVRPGKLARWIRLGASAFKHSAVLYVRCLLSYLGISHSDLIFRTRTGLTLRCSGNPPEPWPIFEVLAFDTYRLAAIADLTARQSVTIVDVGAHVGAFSLEVARRLPNARVFSYEPNPKSYGYLLANIDANGFGDRILPTMNAVGAVASAGLLIQAGAESTVETGQVHSNGEPVTQVEAFPTIALDVAGRIDLLKLDCEGFEYPIILETPRGAWRVVDRILLEYHPIARHRRDDLVRHLSSLGFDLVWEDPDPDVAGLGTAYLTRTTTGL